MLELLQPVPPDAILGLIAEHMNDSRDSKIDLGVGVYRNAAGNTPVLEVVKQAEQRLVKTQTTKAYLGSSGDATFNAAIQSLIFSGVEDGERLTTLQTPGGSGSLRVAAGLIMRARKDATIWVSDPTWGNHIPLLGGAGVQLKRYAYYDAERHVICFDAMLDALRAIPKGEIVLLHACCHNPSGMDPSEEQWRQITEVVVERQLVPYIDMAYQGFAVDLDTDAFAVRHMAALVPEMFVSSSCSKNFGLYRDRVGTLSMLTADPSARDIVRTQANNVVRTMYSMPPDHGAAVVSVILQDKKLSSQWRSELAAMRDRLRETRALLNDALGEKAPDRDFSHLVRATGMFCFLGISAEQVARLKQDFGVYMVDSSRMNVAGVTADNVDYLAGAIAAIL